MNVIGNFLKGKIEAAFLLCSACLALLKRRQRQENRMSLNYRKKTFSLNLMQNTDTN